MIIFFSNARTQENEFNPALRRVRILSEIKLNSAKKRKTIFYSLLKERKRCP